MFRIICVLSLIACSAFAGINNPPYLNRPLYEPTLDPDRPIGLVGTEYVPYSKVLRDLELKLAKKVNQAGGAIGSLRVDGTLQVGRYEIVGTGLFRGVNLQETTDGLAVEVNGDEIMTVTSQQLAFQISKVTREGDHATLQIEAGKLTGVPVIEFRSDWLTGEWVELPATVTGPTGGLYTAVVDVSGYETGFFRAWAQTDVETGLNVKGNLEVSGTFKWSVLTANKTAGTSFTYDVKDGTEQWVTLTDNLATLTFVNLPTNSAVALYVLPQGNFTMPGLDAYPTSMGIWDQPAGAGSTNRYIFVTGSKAEITFGAQTGYDLQ